MKRIIITLSVLLLLLGEQPQAQTTSLEVTETFPQTASPSYYNGYGFTVGYSHGSQTYTTTVPSNTGSNGIVGTQPLGTAYYTAVTSPGFFALGTTLNKAVVFKAGAISRTNRKLARVVWYSANANTSDSMALLVKVGGSLYKYGPGYVSTSARSSASTAFDIPTLHDITLTEASGWQLVTASGGAEISLGAPGALPAGDITEYGWFLSRTGTTSNGNAFRMDDLSIFTTPADGYTQLSTPGSISASGTTLSWSAVTNATSYLVTYNSGGSYTNVGNVTSLTVSTLNQNYFAKYQIGIRAIGTGTYVQSETKWLPTELIPTHLVYQENFAYVANTGDVTFALKWQSYADAAAVNSIHQAGNGDDLLGIAGVRSQYGIIHKTGFLQSGTSSSTKVYSTGTTLSLGISLTGKYISRVTWAQANVQQAGSNNWTLRFMVKIGAQWYVLYNEAGGYKQPGSPGTSTGFSNATFTPDLTINEGEEVWYPLTITNEGGSSSISYTLSSTPIALPPGNMNGAGWYMTSPTTISLVTRVDNLKVYASPTGASSVSTGLPPHYYDSF